MVSGPGARPPIAVHTVPMCSMVSARFSCQAWNEPSVTKPARSSPRASMRDSRIGPRRSNSSSSSAPALASSSTTWPGWSQPSRARRSSRCSMPLGWEAENSARVSGVANTGGPGGVAERDPFSSACSIARRGPSMRQGATVARRRGVVDKSGGRPGPSCSTRPRVPSGSISAVVMTAPIRRASRRPTASPSNSWILECSTQPRAVTVQVPRATTRVCTIGCPGSTSSSGCPWGRERSERKGSMARFCRTFPAWSRG